MRIATVGLAIAVLAAVMVESRSSPPPDVSRSVMVASAPVPVLEMTLVAVPSFDTSLVVHRADTTTVPASVAAVVPLVERGTRRISNYRMPNTPTDSAASNWRKRLLNSRSTNGARFASHDSLSTGTASG